jgi:flagellar hook protein FlgE
MLDSINIGIAGMNAYSDALKTISNNVANMNTPGFKASTSSFSDMIYSNNFSQGSLRSGHYQQFGSGVSYDTTLLNFSTGGMKTNTGPLDLAINGQGFFALTNAQGQKVYVRTGQFELKNGFIVQAGTDAQLQLKLADGTLVAASTVGKEISKAVATTKVAFSGLVSVDAGAADLTTSAINVVDQLGNTQVLSMTVSGATTLDSTGAKNQKVITVKDAKGVVPRRQPFHIHWLAQSTRRRRQCR